MKNISSKWNIKFPTLGDLVSFSLGGLITVFITHVLRLNMLSIDVGRIIQANYGMELTQLEFIIFLFSITTVLTLPLLVNKDKYTNIKTCGLILLVFINIGSFLSVFARNEITNAFVVLLLMLSVSLVKIFIKFLKISYNWFLLSEEESRVNVAKVTLLWTIMVFVLGILL